MRQGIRAQIAQESLARNKRRSELRSRCAARAALVIGRPISQAANPSQALAAVVAEIRG